MVRDEAV